MLLNIITLVKQAEDLVMIKCNVSPERNASSIWLPKIKVDKFKDICLDKRIKNIFQELCSRLCLK